MPFGADGGLDIPALRRDMARLTGDLAVDGVFCAGVMSEFWALTGTERRQVVEAVIGEAAGRCQVIAHTGHHSADETIELTRHAQQAGADFVVVINPYYPSADDDGLYQWFARVCARADIGVWLFDTRFAQVSLSLDLIDRLADIPNVCGIKVGHDHARYLEVLRGWGTASWCASRTREPGWRTCVITASGSSCHRPRRISTRWPAGGRCGTTPSSPWPGTWPRRPR